MSCRGVHFALSKDEAKNLEAFDSDKDRVQYLFNEIEERYFSEYEAYLAQSDKAWDAMHRALSDGRLGSNSGEYPLNYVVLGGKQLHSGDDFILSLKTPEQVADISNAIAGIDKEEFKTRYYKIDPTNYDGEISASDLDYTWEWFQGVRQLFAIAARDGRYVLFCVDL